LLSNDRSPPAATILRQADLEVEDQGGRKSEVVHFDGHKRHAAISSAASSGRCHTARNLPEAVAEGLSGRRSGWRQMAARTEPSVPPPSRGGCQGWLSGVAVCNLLKLLGLWFGWRS
jgi:hypothetical protein